MPWIGGPQSPVAAERPTASVSVPGCPNPVPVCESPAAVERPGTSIAACPTPETARAPLARPELGITGRRCTNAWSPQHIQQTPLAVQSAQKMSCLVSETNHEHTVTHTHTRGRAHTHTHNIANIAIALITKPTTVLRPSSILPYQVVCDCWAGVLGQR